MLEALDYLLTLGIDVVFYENSSFNNPLITYLIIASLDSAKILALEDKNTIIFRKTTIVQSLLSKLIYSSRLFTLKYLILLSTTTTRVDNALKFIESRLTINASNYFTEYYTLRIKLKYYNYNIISSYKPIDDIDPDTLAIDNIRIPINTLRSLFIKSLEDLEDLFFREIILFKKKEDNIIDLDLSKIFDLKDNNTPLEDLTSSKYLARYKDTLIKKFINKDLILDPSLGSKASIKDGILSYFKKVYNFLVSLALNIYLLSSSPLRGKAIILLKFRNTSLGTLRDIFLDKSNNLIALNTSNLDKTRDSTTLNTNTIRFLPIRLIRIIVYYITFIIPLIEYLRINYLDVTTLETKLFFKLYNKSITSSTLSKALKNTTKKYFNKGISIKQYRHLITYIIKERILVEKPELLSPRSNKKAIGSSNLGQSNIEDILAGHSTKTANLNYARETNYFSNKTRDTTNRSLAFSKLYFNYFNLLEDKSIRDILKDKVEYISRVKSYKTTSKESSSTSSTLSTLDSSSLNLSNNSDNKTLTIPKVLESLKGNNSNSSSDSNKSFTFKNLFNSPKTLLTEDNTRKNRLTPKALRLLNNKTFSPSKETLIEDYITTINIEVEDSPKPRSISKEKSNKESLRPSSNPSSISTRSKKSKSSSRIKSLKDPKTTLELRSNLVVPSSSKILVPKLSTKRSFSNRESPNTSKSKSPNSNVEEDRNIEEVEEIVKKKGGRPKKIKSGRKGGRPRKE